MANGRVSFWLPQIVPVTGGLSSATVILLTAISYAAATIGLVVIGSRSDATAERRWLVVGAAIAISLPASPARTAASDR